MSGFLTALLFVGGAVAYAVIGVLVGRKYTHRRVAEGHNDVLVPLFLTAGVIYAVLLGFMVVAVWESYDAAHANAAEEAATLVPLYRTTYDMAPEKGAAMRKLLRGYAEAVVNDEWASIRDTGHASEKARKISGDVLRVYGTLTPSTKIKEIIDAQFLSTYSQVLVDRNKRLLQASEQLSWIMWFGVLAGAVVVIGMSFVLFMERVVLHVLMTGVMAALIGTSLFMMDVLNRPFVGPVAIDPAPFEASLKVFDDVDRGN
ncbi:MAG TPA: hypothetical protein VNU97_06175 [Rhizomicrobium sp.]|nr:hypothetical protein [Rhizomicrobium sp.]